MRNFKQPGKVLTLTAPTGGVTGGLGYLIGAFFVVASGSAAEAAEFEGQTEGVFELVKTTGQAWTVGQLMYWDDSTKKVSSVATVGRLIGAATAAAGSSDTTGDVRLNGAPSGVLEGAQAAIVDLDLTTLTDTPASADALRDNLTATWEGEIQTKVNAILAVLRTTGIIAP